MSESVLSSQKPFGFIGISAILSILIIFRWKSKSQKPFGFIGISAIDKEMEMNNLGKQSQKPFGFIGISAGGNRRVAPGAERPQSQKPFGFIGISAITLEKQLESSMVTVTKAFRLHWHFCLWHII